MYLTLKDTSGEKLFNFEKQALSEFFHAHTTKKNEPTDDIRVYQGGVFFPKEAKNLGDDENPVLEWVFSTKDPDRVGDSIQQKGIQLDHYIRNSVILWAHDHSRPAIGLARDVTTQGGKLKGTVGFTEKGVDHFGWSIGQKALAGIIKAGSVGLRIIEWEWIEEDRAEELGYDFLIKKSELLEFSMCNVPMNPFALQKQIEPITNIEDLFKSKTQPEVEADEDTTDNSTAGEEEVVGLSALFSGGK